MPKILVIHAPQASAYAPELLRASTGHDVTVGFREIVAAANPRLVKIFQGLFPVRILPDRREVPDLERYDGICSFADSEVDYLDRLLQQRGKPVLLGAWDKSRQRALLERSGIPSAGSVVVRDPSETEAALARVGRPAIVKPLRGAGGDGVSVASSPGDISRALDQRSGAPLLVEEMLDFRGAHPALPWLGNLASVEVSTVNSTHRTIAIHAKVAVQAVRGEAGQLVPRVCGDMYPSGIPAELQQELQAVTHAALDALGVENRATHTELLMTDDGCKVVEVNGRMGGFLDRLLKPHGIDLVRASLEATVAIKPTDPARTDVWSLGFFPSFCDPYVGRVRSDVAVRQVAALDGVDGIEVVARAGQERVDVDGRAVNVVLRTTSVESMGQVFAAVKDSVADLYLGDGDFRESWSIGDR